MRILILDDDEARHEQFKRDLPDHSRLHVHNCGEACAALDAEKFDLAMLDHDLADFVPGMYNAKEERTGLDVVCHIVSMPEDKRPLRVVVHSWNSAGAWRMMADLRRAGIWSRYRPFGGETPAGIQLIREVSFCLREYAPDVGAL